MDKDNVSDRWIMKIWQVFYVPTVSFEEYPRSVFYFIFYKTEWQ